MEKHVKDYIGKYEEFIFRKPPTEIEEINGQDVYEVLQEQKETAGGLNQWTPTSLKISSTKKACNKMADMMNIIEGGAT